jgi:hypothetical protein
MLWFSATDGDLLHELCPNDPWILDVLSRAMVMTIVLRAREGDHRMPACSPAESSCAPFWSLLDGQEVDGYGVAELIGRLRLGGDGE